MQLNNYFTENPNIGEVIKKLCIDLYNKNTQQNILFIRTPSTGGWCDDILVEEINATRILYKTRRKLFRDYHTSTIIIEQSEIETSLASLNKTFDLICMDTFHEYNESTRDLQILSSYLSDNGILISHDCSPIEKSHASPFFTEGWWSGITYGCFIEFAYNNPQWFYSVLDIDTGIGILSKKKLDDLKQNFNRDKQEIFIKMMKAQNENTYDYYKENGKELINLIQRQL